MDANDKGKSLKDLILQKEKEGKVVFMTIEGPMFADLDEFIKQPVEGLLYDLNRDRVTVLSWMEQGNPRSINDFATMLVITRLKEKLEKLEK